MKKLYYAAHAYMIVGLVGGLYYRELTKLNDFTGDSQLGLVHTHVLALGMLFFLIALALEKLFTLSAGGLFNGFFWTYNAGLVITVAVMTVRGTQTVLGHHTPEAAAAIAGVGHIALTVGLIFFFINLGKCIAKASATTDPDSRPQPADR
ncbi:DUF2871 domain-containing protein [Actinomadura verrucosospora]|uniref:DUF2871 domain-containing protein n=1 Tax=Actinomadura verrucosospora TaxID=46165 RepID=A0A7D3VTH3_ACTVE|nr:DUF2871 domain-containing protein [Actinomadura verrucosospora]QKG18592.1 hypothetical protein ACTIVE_0226 [Actinomadura verrucosospora]